MTSLILFDTPQLNDGKKKRGLWKLKTGEANRKNKSCNAGIIFRVQLIVINNRYYGWFMCSMRFRKDFSRNFRTIQLSYHDTEFITLFESSTLGGIMLSDFLFPFGA